MKLITFLNCKIFVYIIYDNVIINDIVHLVKFKLYLNPFDKTADRPLAIVVCLVLTSSLVARYNHGV